MGFNSQCVWRSVHLRVSHVEQAQHVPLLVKQVGSMFYIYCVHGNIVMKGWLNMYYFSKKDTGGNIKHF